VLVALWRIPGQADGRVLVGVFNYNRKTPKDVEVKLDLTRLGLAGKPPVMRDLYKEFSESSLDYYSGKLSLKAITPGSGRLIAIRRY